MPHPQEASSKILNSWLIGSLVIVAFVILCSRLPVLFQRLSSPVQVQQSDAINVERALVILRGEDLYPPSDRQGPYLYSAYPPLFFRLEAFLLPMFFNPWVPGRLLALLGFLGCGFLLARPLTGRLSWAWRFLLPLLILDFPAWNRWGTVDRPDTLALFLNLAAFSLVLPEGTRPAKSGKGPWPWVLAGLLNGAAFLIKQNSVTLLVSVVLFGLVKRRWESLLFGAVSGGIIVLGLGAEYLRWGPYFFKHIFVWVNAGYRRDILFYWLKGDFLQENGPLVLLVLWAAFRQRPSLLVGLQLGFSILALLSLGRLTGAENYWLEFSLYGLVFVRESLAGMEDKAPLHRGWGWVGLLLVAALLFQDHGHAVRDVPSAQDFQMKKSAVAFLGPGDCLVLDSDLAVMAGKRIWIQPAEYCAMVAKGVWSQDSLIADIRAHRFSTIELYDIPRQYLLPPKVVAEIETSYRVSAREFGRRWYVPKVR